MRYELDFEYSDALVRTASNRALRRAIGWRLPVLLALVIVVSVSLCADGQSEYACGFLQGALVAAIGLGILINVSRRRAALRWAGKLPTRAARCIITDESLTFENAFAISVLRWPIVQRVVRGPDVWLFLLSRAQMFALPADKLGADVAAFIEARVTAAGGKML